mgnify:CR=1 FL=1
MRVNKQIFHTVLDVLSFRRLLGPTILRAGFLIGMGMIVSIMFLLESKAGAVWNFKSILDSMCFFVGGGLILRIFLEFFMVFFSTYERICHIAAQVLGLSSAQAVHARLVAEGFQVKFTRSACWAWLSFKGAWSYPYVLCGVFYLISCIMVYQLWAGQLTVAFLTLHPDDLLALHASTPVVSHQHISFLLPVWPVLWPFLLLKKFGVFSFQSSGTVSNTLLVTSFLLNLMYWRTMIEKLYVWLLRLPAYEMILNAVRQGGAAGE